MIDYDAEYLKFHKLPWKFDGHSTYEFRHLIYNIIKRTRSKTILDYGSGKGIQYKKQNLDLYWSVEAVCYDPYYQPYNKLPDNQFDGVICVEVLEHVPEERLEIVFTNIFSRAKKFVFFTICMITGGTFFTTGENVHITIQSKDWWIEKIKKYNVNKIPVDIVFTGNKYEFETINENQPL